MSTFNVNSIFNNKTIFNNINEKENSLSLEIGEIFDAVVKNKSDGIATLQAKGATFYASSESIKADVNETVSLEVKSVSSSKVELAQVFPKTDKVLDEKFKQASSDEILEMFKQNNLYVEEDILETSDEEVKERQAREVIKKIQNEILYATNNTSDSAVLELLSNNISLNKITLGILSKVMTEIDKKPLYTPTDEEIENITNKYIEENNISPEGFKQKAEIIKSLRENGLNVTSSNISQIENAIKKFNDATENGNLDILINEDSIDIDTLVETSFSSSDKFEDLVSKNENLYKDLANSFGMSLTPDLKNVFNSFLSKDIDITKENVEKLSEFYEKLDNIDTKNLIDKMSFAISNGQKATDISIFDEISENIPGEQLLEKTLDTKEILPSVTRENISYLILNGKVLNIGNIKLSVLNNEKAPVQSEMSENINNEQKNILSLMQKLTFEASYKLSKSGIDIDTQTVTEALESIDTLNKNTYKLALSSLDSENTYQTTENVNKISSIYEKFDALALLNLNSKFNKVDGSDIIKNISDYSNLFENSAVGYDVFATKVTGKWNDKITNYEEQIIPILEEMGLSPTKENIKASELLIKSKIDLTPQNIVDVKNVDLKIDTILETLHPRIVANMIKDNINPLSLNLDEIISYIDTFEEEFGDNSDDKLAKNILAIQKDNTISDETKKAIKSFYKALNIISKNDKVSIAKTLETNHELTIKNLLDISKYFDKTKGIKTMVSETISDTIKTYSKNENSITNTIEHALQVEYERNLMKKLDRVSTKDALANLIETEPNYKEKLVEDTISVLEDFNQKISNIDVKNNDIQFYLEKLNEALSNTPVAVNFLAENDVPLSIENLYSFKEMLKEPFKLRKKLTEYIEKEESLKDSFNSISEKDISSLSGVGSVLDIQIGNIENNVPEDLDLSLKKSSILENLNLLNLFNKNDESNFSQMVVKLPLSDEVTTLNMYVIDENFETKQEKSISFSLETDFLGKIEANLNISLSSVDININGDYNGVNFLKDNERELSDLFLEFGYKDVSINFVNTDVNSIFYKQMG